MALLIFLGLGGLGGGLGFIARPDGSLLQIPVAWLAPTPFRSFLVPGVVLLVVNGLLPLATVPLVLRGHAAAPWVVMAQGALLTGWISIQMLMLQTFFPPLHAPYLVLGVLLFALGLAGRRAPPTGGADAAI